MSKSSASGRHASSSSRVARHGIDAALHENPLLADAAPPQLLRQLETARRVIPEEIVRDEDVIADRRHVAADRHRSNARAPRARAAARSSRTNSGTDSRAPFPRATPADGPDRHTACATAPRAGVRAAAPRPASACPSRPPCAPCRPHHREARARARVVSGAPRDSAAQMRGSACSPSSRTTAATSAEMKGSGYAAAVCPPMTTGTVRSEAPHVAHQVHDLVALEGVHGGNADQRRTAVAEHPCRAGG